VPFEPMPEYFPVIRNNENLVPHHEHPPVVAVGTDSRCDRPRLASELTSAMHEAIDSVREDVAVFRHDDQIVSVREQPLVDGSRGHGNRAGYGWNAHRYADGAVPDWMLEDAAVRRNDEDTAALNEHPLVFRACGYCVSEGLRIAESPSVDGMG